MSTRLTALAFALLAAPAFAQESPEIQKLRAEFDRRLEILSKEVEAQKSGTTVEAKEQGAYGLGAAASKVYEAKGGLSIGGYGEFLYSNLEGKLQDGTKVPNERTLDALRLILYTGYKFSDKIVFNSEVEFEHGGYSDEHVEGEVKVEFAYLDFLLTKEVNIRAGMVLLPLGFLNELHEPPAFLGARRSFTEKYIIPSTWHENGAGIHGDLPANLSYRLFLVNGLDAFGRGEEGLTEGFSAEGIRGGRQAGKESLSRSLAWTGRLDWNPRPGMTVGGGFYTGNSNQSGEGPALRTNLLEIHGEYRARGWQARGLFARITNGESAVDNLPVASEARNVGTEQFGGYLEVGYDLLAGRGKQSLVPFARWERLNTQQKVVSGVVADGANYRTVLTMGVNYKPIPQVAVKADFTRLENRAKTGQNSFNVALGYYF